MRAARMHQIGGSLKIEDVAVPSIGETDVLVKVKACRIPNLRYTIENVTTIYPGSVLPTLPAIFGFDVTGVVEEKGANVQMPDVGSRVYISPGLACGTCQICRKAEPTNCRCFCFPGFFGMSAESLPFLDKYQGGMAEYVVAPGKNVFAIPGNLSFEAAVRLDYLTTTYSALRKARVGPGDTLLINGASGTLGTCGLVIALAMGVTRIVVAARNSYMLDELVRIDPSRVVAHQTGSSESLSQAAVDLTEGIGVDAVLDCLGPAAPAEVAMEGLKALRRGGRMVIAGGLAQNLPIHSRRLQFNQHSIMGSLLFTAEELNSVIAMIGAGTVNLSMFKTSRFHLDDIDEGLRAVEQRDSGLTNFIVCPD